MTDSAQQPVTFAVGDVVRRTRLCGGGFFAAAGQPFIQGA